jgi:hypothetical protein
MFVLSADRATWWPVTIKVPQDGGTFVDHEISARFRLLPKEEIEAGVGSETALLERVVVDWQGVQSEGGEAIAFSEARRGELLAVPYVRAGLLAAYLECWHGSRRKN